MNLKANSYKLRQDILDIVYHAKGGHIGGDMSVIDTLNVLYNKQMNVTPENFHDPDHDRFILSKGHTVEALYAVLCQKGFFPREDLKTVSQYLSKYIGHPNNKVNGIEMNSGSLGHGLSVAIGMALAGKMDKRDYRVYVVMGDGELAEVALCTRLPPLAQVKVQRCFQRVQLTGFRAVIQAFLNAVDTMRRTESQQGVHLLC